MLARKKSHLTTEGVFALVSWRTGGGEEFHALREFRGGDNPKCIHWKASARMGKWMVKEFERKQRGRVFLAVFHF